MLYTQGANAIRIINGFDVFWALASGWNINGGSFTHPAKPFLFVGIDQKSGLHFYSSLAEQTKKKNETMIQRSLKPEILGTRTGYVIRFTCPVCHFENSIINKTPREHFRNTRDATCKQCRKRSTVLTPGTNDKPAPSYVPSYYECTKLE